MQTILISFLLFGLASSIVIAPIYAVWRIKGDGKMTKQEALKATTDAGKIYLGANAKPPIFREDVSASKIRKS